jgi:predicted transcriptional regulator
VSQNNEVVLGFKISPEMKKQIEKRAAELDLTVSAVLRRLVRNYLNGQSRQEQPVNAGGSGEQKRAA